MGVGGSAGQLLAEGVHGRAVVAAFHGRSAEPIPHFGQLAIAQAALFAQVEQDGFGRGCVAIVPILLGKGEQVAGGQIGQGDGRGGGLGVDDDLGRGTGDCIWQSFLANGGDVAGQCLGGLVCGLWVLGWGGEGLERGSEGGGRPWDRGGGQG